MTTKAISHFQADHILTRFVFPPLLQMARKFVESINRHGGNATLVELPQIGIYGNTHFLMQDLNNIELVELLNQWLIKQYL